MIVFDGFKTTAAADVAAEVVSDDLSDELFELLEPFVFSVEMTSAFVYETVIGIILDNKTGFSESLS